VASRCHCHLCPACMVGSLRHTAGFTNRPNIRSFKNKSSVNTITCLVVVMETRCCLEVGTEFSCIIWISIFSEARQWLWRLVAGLLPRRAGPDLVRVHVISVVDKVALRQGFLRILWLSPTSIIPPMSQTHFHVHVTFTRRTNGRSLGSFKTQCCLANRGASDRTIVSLFHPSKTWRR
jgi:hypothetical protein